LILPHTRPRSQPWTWWISFRFHCHPDIETHVRGLIDTLICTCRKTTWNWNTLPWQTLRRLLWAQKKRTSRPQLLNLWVLPLLWCWLIIASRPWFVFAMCPVPWVHRLRKRRRQLLSRKNASLCSRRLRLPWSPIRFESAWLRLFSRFCSDHVLLRAKS